MPRPTHRARITRRGPSGSSCSCSRCSSTSPGRLEMGRLDRGPRHGLVVALPLTAPRPAAALAGSSISWRCMLVFGLVGGAGYLTVEALQADASDKQFSRPARRPTPPRPPGASLAASPAWRARRRVPGS